MGDLKDKALETKMKSLVRLIVDSISPDSWRDNGGSVGSILTFDSKLIISQSSRTQEEIAILLEKRPDLCLKLLELLCARLRKSESLPERR